MHKRQVFLLFVIVECYCRFQFVEMSYDKRYNRHVDSKLVTPRLLMSCALLIASYHQTFFAYQADEFYQIEHQYHGWTIFVV
uniref:Secreted protein n=1 Tax=Brugia timori TaxID=42155 RepID=A0A0R3QUS7_9BILA